MQIAEEDRQRAQYYRLLAHMLACIPQKESLKLLAELTGDGSALGQAVDALAAVARDTSPEQADDEYHDLFIGVERAEGVREPEDHIASVCEIMAGLIEGRFGAAASLSEQAAFFDRHVASWAPQFFRDLENAETASLYRPVGAVGRIFMEIESTAFELAA